MKIREPEEPCPGPRMLLRAVGSFFAAVLAAGRRSRTGDSINPRIGKERMPDSKTIGTGFTLGRQKKRIIMDVPSPPHPVIVSLSSWMI